MIQVDDRDGVAVLRMVRGKGNALNTEFLEALVRALNEVEQSSAQAMVITGEGKIFCAGVDLPTVAAGGADYLQSFLPALTAFLRRLALFPRPVVAAVNGHAIAGGCIGVLACDYRVLAEGRGRLGLTELLVGVPFPTWALEIARFGLPDRSLQEVVYTGKTFLPDEALARGFVDEIVPAERLLDRAIQVARRFADVAPETFTLTKQHLRGPLVERADGRASRDDPDVLDIWAGPATAERMVEFVAKTVKRGA